MVKTTKFIKILATLNQQIYSNSCAKYIICHKVLVYLNFFYIEIKMSSEHTFLWKGKL